ncbi:ribosomal protein S18 acetylase RimI-like enzyme [Paenibacillus mucilaginosus]|uniref:GNAT family N-acetyltransferase n=1 Tax=Paenibacillus mucilaginosus TaxID=61624 RepID=UPI003D1F6737
MKPGGRIAPLTSADQESFAAVMGRAFADDPLFLHLFGPSKSDRFAAKRVRLFLTLVFKKALLQGEDMRGYFENCRLAGAYLAEPPRTSRSGMRQNVKLAGLLLPLLFRLPLRSLGQLNAYMRVTRNAAPVTAHHYLAMLGVDPSAQGKGIGRALLLDLFGRVHAHAGSQGAALDTENRRNVDWYVSLGFVLSAEASLGGLTLYCMHWAPK